MSAYSYVGDDGVTSTVPFGLLFEEPTNTTSDADDHLPEPVYDSQDGVSYVLDTTGERVPFIIFAFSTVGLTKTNSSTKALVDSDDYEEDPPKPKS